MVNALLTLRAVASKERGGKNAFISPRLILWDSSGHCTPSAILYQLPGSAFSFSAIFMYFGSGRLPLPVEPGGSSLIMLIVSLRLSVRVGPILAALP